MKCPYCESRIADGSEVCPVCRASLPSSVEASPFSAGREEVHRSDDELSLGAKLMVWLGLVFSPILGAVVVAILYYSWKKDYPNKASQLNLHCWLAFFAGIALSVGCVLFMGGRLGAAGAGGGVRVLPPREQSQARQFRDYVEVVRRENGDSTGEKVTGDEATRTIVIRHKLAGKASDLASPKVFKERFKAVAAKSAVFRQDLVQIRELGITIVYRVETSDGKTIDVPFAPSDWDGMK